MKRAQIENSKSKTELPPDLSDSPNIATLVLERGKQVRIKCFLLREHRHFHISMPKVSVQRLILAI